MRDLTGEWQRQDFHSLVVSLSHFERTASPVSPTCTHVDIRAETDERVDVEQLESNCEDGPG